MARADDEVTALGRTRARAHRGARRLARRDRDDGRGRGGRARGVDEVQAADAVDRERLAAERMRRRPRAPAGGRRPPPRRDHAELEARLGLEALHEGVVVELAGLAVRDRAPRGCGRGAPQRRGGRTGEGRGRSATRPCVPANAAATRRRTAVADEVAALEAALDVGHADLGRGAGAAGPEPGPTRPASPRSTTSARSTRTRSMSTPRSRCGSRRSRRRRPTCAPRSCGRASSSSSSTR